MRADERTILVVVDDPSLRVRFQDVLGAAEYSVLVAEDGASALHISEEYAGPIHLLLTDVILRKMSGEEIAERLSALRPQMKVRFMSGFAKGVIRQHTTLGPEANFIQEPWSPRGLCEEIHGLLTTQPSAQRILVVDDEAGMRGLLSEILEGAGHQVFTARDGLEARAIAKRQRLDFVITDISMPNEEGLGLIRAIRKEHSGLKIIATSGGDPEVLIDAKLLGADAALRKPVTAEKLLQCVCDFSQGRSADIQESDAATKPGNAPTG
jgi:DNA-binding NtrC family response regulator